MEKPAVCRVRSVDIIDDGKMRKSKNNKIAILLCKIPLEESTVD